MQLSPGTLLQDRYRLDKALGHGGFGITYRAEDLTLKVPVAIKEYLPLQVATRLAGQTRLTVHGGEARDRFEYGLKRFLEEARALARCAHHPNIVAVKDYFEANGTAYMVMEYVEGITFHQFLQQQGGRISLAQAKGIMLPIMGALAEVHQAGLLHRDISPDNIYLTISGPVKLLDFGAARYFIGEQSQSLSIILKSGYAPEEQYRPSGRQGAWTDVYAVAATLYRAITGVTPPDALDRKEADTLVPPSRLGVALSPGEEEALLKGLAVTAAQRYQSMGEFQQALTAGQDPSSRQEDTAPLGEMRTPPPASSTQTTPLLSSSVEMGAGSPSPPFRARTGLMLLASLATAALLLLGGGGLIWWHLQGSPEKGGETPALTTQTQATHSPGGGATSGDAAVQSPGASMGEKPPGATADALLAEGRTLYQAQRYAEAIDKLEEAVRLDPAKAEAHYYLGLSYYQFIRYMEALESFKRALAARADYAEAHAGLGMAYYQLDQAQDAIQALQQAVNLDGKLSEARYYLGLAFLSSGNRDLALQQYQALKSLDPEKAKLLNQELQEPDSAAEPPSQPAQPSTAAPYAGSPRWPWTSERLVTEADLTSLSFEELRLMRNEILARHGWVFRTQDLQEYFQRQPWYRPRGGPDQLVEVNRAVMAGLTSIERQNNAIILRHEMTRKHHPQ